MADKSTERATRKYTGEKTKSKSPKFDRAIREKIYDPMMDKLGGGTAADKSDRAVRKDVLGYKKGGKVKCMAKGGGVERSGKTKGKMC
jgi:hypothetical protein